MVKCFFDEAKGEKVGGIYEKRKKAGYRKTQHVKQFEFYLQIVVEA